MTEKNKQKWNEIIKFAVTVLTALLGALGRADALNCAALQKF